MITYEINEHNQPVVNGEVVRLTNFPHFNGLNWFEFESEEERLAYIEANKQPILWDKQTYCDEISSAIDVIVSAKFIELDYTDFEGKASIGDVNNGVDTPTLTWHLEAVAVRDWYNAVYEYRDSYFATVTEQTAMPIEAFISSLPTFTN